MRLDTVAVLSGMGADRAPIRRRRRIDGRTKTARRVRQLVADYSKRLGEIAADSIVAADIAKLAEHEALAEDLRGAALRRETIDRVVLNDHERYARRLRVSLGLDRPPEPPLPPSYQDWKRKQEAASHD